MAAISGDSGTDSRGAANSARSKNPVRRRVAQLGLDFAISFFLLLVTLAVYLVSLFFLRSLGLSLAAAISVCIVLYLIVWFACSWWWNVWFPSRTGATPTMRWMGLAVVTSRGDRPSREQFTARWVLLLVDGMVFGLVALVAMIVTEQNQRVGDIVARTRVVRVDLK